MAVILDSGDRLSAHVAATDANRDIALIKVDRSFQSKLQFATDAREGEEVIALGYPFGYELGQSMTITTGIVSAFRTSGGVAYIQTDSDINFGNSGGPLLNLRGEVVGMNTAGLRDRDAQGINFAIRYNVLASRLPVLLRAATSPPSATPNPTPTPTPTPGSGPQPIFGPVNGEIEHNLNDGFIDEYVPGGIWIRDGIIEALFENPYLNSTVGYWSYGFLFRQTGANTFHAVILNSKDGHFYHILRTGEASTEQQLTVKPALEMNAGFPGSNRISIVIDGDEGTLYVNGHYTATIQLGGLMDEGSVVVVGNYFRGHGAAGYSTHFRDFTVGPPPKPLFGPVDGEIEHNIHETGFIDTHRASGVQVRDGIIEARFFNPYSVSVGQWSSGFMFRHRRTDSAPTFHIIVITERGYFYHYLRTTGDGESDQRLAVRQLDEIDTAYPGSNHIRIIADGKEGKLYVNGHYIADLQLQGLMEEGSVYAVGTYFSGHGVSGYSTRFEDFTIWPIDALR